MSAQIDQHKTRGRSNSDMLWLKKLNTSGANLVRMSLNILVLQILSYILLHPVDACSQDYIRTLPNTIAGRVDHADIVVYGNVRSKYPYRNTKDYVAGLSLYCVLKAEPEMYDFLSKSSGGMLNISHAGNILY